MFISIVNLYISIIHVYHFIYFDPFCSVSSLLAHLLLIYIILFHLAACQHLLLIIYQLCIFQSDFLLATCQHFYSYNQLSIFRALALSAVCKHFCCLFHASQRFFKLVLLCLQIASTSVVDFCFAWLSACQHILLEFISQCITYSNLFLTSQLTVHFIHWLRIFSSDFPCIATCQHFYS